MQQTAGLEGHFEGHMVAQILRGCRACGQPHPRTRGIDADTCDCGADCEPPAEISADQTVITGKGVHFSVARTLFRAADYLTKLAKRI
jgi:hypothetical protein